MLLAFTVCLASVPAAGKGSPSRDRPRTTGRRETWPFLAPEPPGALGGAKG
jgi:hypothetical protein